MSTLLSTDMNITRPSTRLFAPPGGKTSISFGGDEPTPKAPPAKVENSIFGFAAPAAAPVTAAVPAPEVSAPAPVIAEAPAPVIAETPAPVIAETPAPVVAETPVVAVTPAEVENVVNVTAAQKNVNHYPEKVVKMPVRGYNGQSSISFGDEPSVPHSKACNAPKPAVLQDQAQPVRRGRQAPGGNSTFTLG